MNKLQNVLNDEESMKQIKELADMLAGEMKNSDPPPEAPAEKTPSPTQSDLSNSPDFSAILQSLGGMLGNQSDDRQSSPQQQKPQALPDFDMGKLMKLQSIMQAANKPNKNVDLIMALKPLLKEENQVKADRLIKIFRLFEILPALKESGLLGGDLFGIL